MSAAPYLPLFIDAYVADTTHLSTQEHGAYLLLLMSMWRHNGSVPNDDRDLARITRLSTQRWRKVKARLMPLLLIDGQSLSQKRLKKEWDYVSSIREKNAANGAKGGRPKRQEINGLEKATGSFSVIPNESPHTQTQTQSGFQIENPPPEEVAVFSILWKEWPDAERPDAGPYAEKLFYKLPDNEQRQAVKAAPAFVRCMQARKKPLLLIPFLKQRLFVEFYGAPDVDEKGRFVITPTRPEWDAWLNDTRRQLGDDIAQSMLNQRVLRTEQRWPEGWAKITDEAAERAA
ncbi:YdaU family protein [Mesorhizobium shangrilense]|uniref:DUF1376 domain-containing protein n=1 Tax=Mesorhizobium shangrilense TaxID=460060 RepID=A0ABV2DG36_9HYPH